MENFVAGLTKVNDVINTFIWTKTGVWLLVGVGVIMTVITLFFQVTHIGHWMKHTLGSLFNRDVIGHNKDKTAIINTDMNTTVTNVFPT